MTETTTPIAPTTPAELLHTFARYARQRDVVGLLALYEADAVFQPAPGVALRGHDQIRAGLAELVSLGPEITYDGEHEVVEVGAIALVSSRWSMTGVAPDGTEVTDGGLSADVLRRQADGSWRVLIDQPRGVAAP